MDIEFFIAGRIIKGKGKRKKISRPTIRIAIAGVAIGLAVMIMTVAIVRGFQMSIRDKVEGFNTDIQINDFNYSNSFEPSPIIMDKPLMNTITKLPGVKHVQIYATKSGIIETKTENEGVLLKGVGSDYDWTFIKKNLVKGDVFYPHDSVPSGDIVISKTIASALGVDVDSTLKVFFVTKAKDVDHMGHAGYEQRVKAFHIKGIYHTGLDEFDRQVVFVDIGKIQNLNFWNSMQIGGYEVSCIDFNDADKLEKSINDIIGEKLNAQNIKKINAAVFSWLQLQNTNAAIIIILMTIVAAIAMVSALIVLILENTNMIGLLKALGSTNSSIQKVFLINGAYLIFSGLLIGNIAGLSLCFLQQHFGLIKLDQETYYVSQIPIYLHWRFVVYLNLGAFASCMCMLILPSFIISRISPVKTLRYS